MRVAVRKLDGVDSVGVSLEDGVAVVRFRPGATTTVGQVQRVIRDNGFTPKEAEVRIRGRVVEHDGGLALALPGRPGRHALLGAPDGPVSTDRLRQALGASVEIVGQVSERVSGSELPAPIVVRRLTLRAVGVNIHPGICPAGLRDATAPRPVANLARAR